MKIKITPTDGPVRVMLTSDLLDGHILIVDRETEIDADTILSIEPAADPNRGKQLALKF